jgi:hypothetical protein
VNVRVRVADMRFGALPVMVNVSGTLCLASAITMRALLVSLTLRLVTRPLLAICTAPLPTPKERC